MHSKYKELLDIWVLTKSKSYVRLMKCFLLKLPDPKHLSREWILQLLSQYENNHTRYHYFRLSKIIIRHIGKPDMLAGIDIKKHNKTEITYSEILTPEEIEQLKSVCQTPTELALIEVLSTTGCRASEIMNLRPKHISIEDNIVVFDIATSKTIRRTLYVLASDIPEFVIHLQSCVENRPLFYTNYKKMRLNVIDIFNRASVRRRKQPCHIFRHTIATRLVEQGIPEPLLRQFMGWSATSNMPSIYVHLSSLSLKQFVIRKSLEPTIM